MKKNSKINEVFAIINSLSNEERDACVQEIMNKLGVPCVNEQPEAFEGTRCDAIIAEINPQKPDCPHCAAKATLGYVVKNGTHRGAQRYHCKACGRKFVSITNTAFARTRKSSDTWRKFIEMTLSQKSLAECAAECDICIQTAFDWRHKLLNAFVINQNGMTMSGRVEVDDMFVSVSFKGNRVNGRFGVRTRSHGEDNGLPRKSYHRGSDNKSGVQSKACVLCMVQDQGKAFYASVPGIGPADTNMLQATVGKHVQKDNAHVFSDNNMNNIRFFEQNSYQFRAFASNVSDNRHDHKPEIDGDEHIQNVNNFHSRLRKFLKAYSGVSTKYLGNYVALFAWLDNIRATRQKNSASKVSTARAATRDCYIPHKEIIGRPLIPACPAA